MQFQCWLSPFLAILLTGMPAERPRLLLSGSNMLESHCKNDGDQI